MDVSVECHVTSRQMAEHYGHAPIVEAVLDIRVSSDRPPTLSVLESIQREFNADYPKRSNRVQMTSEILAGDSVASSMSQRQIGFLFASDDDRQVFQVRLDGFSVSRLAPYDRWGTFVAEAKRLWAAYRQTVKPTAATRLALRYINRINLPLPVRDFGDYLRTLPEISPDIPQGLAGYFMRLEIPQDEIGTMLVLTEALLPTSAADETVGVLLDSDVFRPVNITDDLEIWSCFEELRLKKNEVFEACITDKTRELIR